MSAEATAIFVVGAARSGTTLVGEIIGRHCDVSAPGESHFFEEIWSRFHDSRSVAKADMLNQAAEMLVTSYGRHGFLDGQAAVDQVITSEDIAQQVFLAGGGLDSLIREFFSRLAAPAGVQFICDDTPKHVFYLDAIQKCFPTAKIVACIRDPRDYLASYKNYWRRSDDKVRIRRLYHPILTTLLWRGAARQVAVSLESQTSQQFILLPYEQLVTQPEEQIRKLATFLDLSFQPSMLLQESDNSSFGPGQTGIFTHSMGRWRECLGPAEVWWVQRLAGREMAAFGYEKATVRAPLFSLMIPLITLLPGTLRALWANRGRRGPLLSYVVRRLRLIAKS